MENAGELFLRNTFHGFDIRQDIGEPPTKAVFGQFHLLLISNVSMELTSI